MEPWSSGGGVGTCRSLPQELWRCAAGVGTSRYGDRELWRRAVRVLTWRGHRGSEIWRCAAAVEKLEIWSSGGTLQACRRRDVEVCLLLLEFLAFVPRGLRFASQL